MHPSLFAMQAVPPANNGAVTETQASQSVESGSEGAAPPDSIGFGSSSMLMMVVPLLLFMFWQSRSQQKKQDATISGLKTGDRVVTQSGLIGRLVELDKRIAKLELAPGVKVQVLRSSLTGRDDDSPSSSSKSDSSKSDSKSDSSKSPKDDGKK